jgi:hypothetical protein
MIVKIWLPHTILISNVSAANFLSAENCAKLSVVIQNVQRYAARLTQRARIPRLFKNAGHDCNKAEGET